MGVEEGSLLGVSLQSDKLLLHKNEQRLCPLKPVVIVGGLNETVQQPHNCVSDPIVGCFFDGDKQLDYVLG
jgi:hypothetical protein